MNGKDGSRNALVLVADDDAMLRLLSVKALEKAGFAVSEAENGEEAVSAFDRLRPDIVMLDVMMPVMDGFSACAAIRRHPEGGRTPVLMVTGLDDVDSINRAYEAGATDFMTKPISWPVLGHRIRYMLRAGRSIEALRDSEERYALAAMGANDGLWDWDLKDGKCHFSLRWKGMSGYEDDEIGNSPDEWLSRVHPDDADRVRLDLDAHIEGVSRHFESEYRLKHRDGTYRWMLSRGMAVRDGDNAAYRMAGSQTDITETKRIAEQLQRDAFYDPLTKLPNRALFMDRLGHAVTRGKRLKSYNFGVLFLDLDRFKLINDTLGHSVGDDLLVQTADRIGRFIAPGTPSPGWGATSSSFSSKTSKRSAARRSWRKGSRSSSASPSAWTAGRSSLRRASGSPSAPGNTSGPRSCCATRTSPCIGQRRKEGAPMSCSTRRCRRPRRS